MQIFFSRKRDQIRLISTRIRHQLPQLVNQHSTRHLIQLTQIPILVTMPRLLCENSPSLNGPKPYGNNCQHLFPGSSSGQVCLSPGFLGWGMAPMPVRMSSPFGRMTSIPQCIIQWSISVSFDLGEEREVHTSIGGISHATFNCVAEY